MIKCTFCGSYETPVYDQTVIQYVIIRYRQCKDAQCLKKFLTIELFLPETEHKTDEKCIPSLDKAMILLQKGG